MLFNIDEIMLKMYGQVENMCGPVNFGSNLPSGNLKFRNSYIPVPLSFKFSITVSTSTGLIGDI